MAAEGYHSKGSVALSVVTIRSHSRRGCGGVPGEVGASGVLRQLDRAMVTNQPRHALTSTSSALERSLGSRLDQARVGFIREYRPQMFVTWTAPRRAAGRSVRARSDRSRRFKTIGADERQVVSDGQRLAIPWRSDAIRTDEHQLRRLTVRSLVANNCGRRWQTKPPDVS